MKILLRVLLSVMGNILAYAIIDYYFDGVVKYILWGLSTAVFLQYNDKKNREYKKTKENNT
ncbi:hypothetical protein [Sporosarcina sp. YIM B06819]|uniref:hypothetical protein n=1 Tax=Sporosarcina sp. YIM B06819 TaxID=3081769 RepID=UPI00298C918A|nr:hypothetical protein [Sporosarcina sp. YIM B06819]